MCIRDRCLFPFVVVPDAAAGYHSLVFAHLTLCQRQHALTYEAAAIQFCTLILVDLRSCSPKSRITCDEQTAAVF